MERQGGSGTRKTVVAAMRSESIGLVLGASILGATLGSVGYAGTEFWRNREMCACANVGLVDDDAAGVERSSRGEIRGGVVRGLAGGASLGGGLALLLSVVSGRRLRRAMRELAADDLATPPAEANRGSPATR